MPRYFYKAKKADGELVTGYTAGVSSEEVSEKMGSKGLTVIKIEELGFDGKRKNESFMEKFSAGFKKMQTKVPYKDVVFFTRQLATMISGGVSLSRALSQLALNEKPIFKKIILQIADDISSGHTFADSIARHPGAFNQMYISVSHSGEISGSLDRVLEELATYMENTEAMRAKVKGAMRYPTFILSFVVLLTIGIMWKLVPVFQNMYAGMGAGLPLPTLILVNVSEFVQSYLLMIILFIIASIIAFKIAMTKDAFKYQVHKYVLYTPVFGLIMKKNIWAVFSRTMALLLECGIPILQAVEIGGAVVGNMVYAEAIKNVHENLKKGELLSTSLERTKIFPVLVSQLVMTGEESGKIDQLLRKVAGFYDREINVTVDSLASILEPFLIIILGGIVGSILVALYMPIFSIGKHMT